MSKKRFVDNLKEIWYIFVVVIIVVAINLFIGRVGVTVGDSMSPTLENGNPIFINLIDSIDRKEVIVFKHDSNTRYLIKRVIGLPGDTVKIDNNIIYINGEPITDAVSIQMENYGVAKDGITLGEDEYFVMGDNRNNSYDSREFGAIKADSILGTVHRSLIPFKNVY